MRNILYQNKNWLKEKYKNQKLSTYQIANLCNVNPVTIWNWLNKFNIPMKWKSEYYFKHDISKKWLKTKYLREKLSTYEIAKICKVNQGVISRRLKYFGIPIRSQGESNHLSRGNHCFLSSKAREFIDGELFGDGSLQSRSPYSACFQYSSKHEEYINYIANTLKSFGIEQAGNICKKTNKDHGSISYCYSSRCYKELLPIRKHWYPDSKKIVPRDIELTPLVCRQWYIGDGYLGHSHRTKGTKSDIRLCTYSLPINNVEFLVRKLNKLGFRATRQLCNNIIHISSYSVKAFLDYIGPCPVECYSYKWRLVENRNFAYFL